MLNRRETLAAAFGLAAAGVSPHAQAAALDKLVHIIVGFPAGGGTDIVARLLGDALRGAYAANVIVEDKPGASARLAVDYVKTAPRTAP